MNPQFVNNVRSLFKTKGFNTTENAEAIMHAAIGISGEAGEILDTAKKHWVYNKPLDIENLYEELGDLLFYTTALMIITGIDLEEVLVRNVEKLKKRYPDGYTDTAAQARADKEGN